MSPVVSGVQCRRNRPLGSEYLRSILDGLIVISGNVFNHLLGIHIAKAHKIADRECDISVVRATVSISPKNRILTMKFGSKSLALIAFLCVASPAAAEDFMVTFHVERTPSNLLLTSS